MATETLMLSSVAPSTVPVSDRGASKQSPSASFPDPDWSSTYLNYYQDADQPPPSTADTKLSEHELRIVRRGDDSPNIARTPVSIRNIQGREAEYNLSIHGFMLKAVYFSEVSELLKRDTGAKYVFQYEHHVRTATLEDALAKDSKGAVDIDGPVRRVHIDESPASARNEYAHYIRPDDPGNEHLKGRPFGIYNVWKPLATVRRDPLCLCDARSLGDEDLQSGKVTVPNVGEIENFVIRPPIEEGRHSFVYVRHQRPEQALVFRIYDGRVDGVVGEKRSHGVAHTSFPDPGTEDEAPRQSVEVRSFCIF
ncbi:hypothetical protein LTR36_006272 [Oleoguttula mirabilis]|uniref:Uncharacterized protein n=1 Tax=Oleoguttula mirabilis TaxID=1507867 RepID=A0AAV9JD07_9PEZI|nr:hypothetical protein LTR36_006272 [Oleoguttula mirabilis]